MTASRNTIIIFGVYLLAWTLLVSGKAIDNNSGLKASDDPVHLSTTGSTGADMPPLIFPTDKQKNKILPVNKTAIKILMHEDDIYNSSSSATKEADKEKTNLELKTSSGEADDLRKTDELIATSEEEHAKYAKLHPVVTEKGSLVDNSGVQKGVKDQVENIQEVSSRFSDLEEQYDRPQQNYIAIMNIKEDSSVRDHLAWITVTIVGVLAMTIFAVLLVWRNKLEQRYGNRHRLFTDEDTL